MIHVEAEALDREQPPAMVEVPSSESGKAPLRNALASSTSASEISPLASRCHSRRTSSIGRRDLVVLGGEPSDDQGLVGQRFKHRPDGVDEAAFLSELDEKPRRECPTADDMVEHDRRHVVRRGRSHANVSEHTGGLWERQSDDQGSEGTNTAAGRAGVIPRSGSSPKTWSSASASSATLMAPAALTMRFSLADAPHKSRSADHPQ